jgi:hypothetical protein
LQVGDTGPVESARRSNSRVLGSPFSGLSGQSLFLLQLSTVFSVIPLTLCPFFTLVILNILIYRGVKECIARIRVHCKEIWIYLFLKKELRGLSPNFHIHVSVSDLYIFTFGSPIFLQQNRQTDQRNM